MITVSQNRYGWALIIALALPSPNIGASSDKVAADENSGWFTSWNNSLNRAYKDTQNYLNSLGQRVGQTILETRIGQALAGGAAILTIHYLLYKGTQAKNSFRYAKLSLKEMTDQHIIHNHKIKLTPENINFIKEYEEKAASYYIETISARAYIEFLALQHILESNGLNNIHSQDLTPMIKRMNLLLPEPISRESIQFFDDILRNTLAYTPIDRSKLNVLKVLKYTGIK